jgi:hypothetical protein
MGYYVCGPFKLFFVDEDLFFARTPLALNEENSLAAQTPVVV